MKSLHFHRAAVLCVAVGLAVPALAQQTAAMPKIEGDTARVLVKRGTAYLQVTDALVLEPADSLVLLEGAAVELKCDGTTITSFSDTGIYAIPQCPAQVAVAVTPAPPATAGPAPAATASGTRGVSTAMITTGVIVAAVGIAAAAGGGGGDGGGEPPISP